MNEIKPIIIIGMNRSGTKWLSNILCNHHDVIGVQSERAKGILESDILRGYIESKFDLRYPDDYVAFIELWSSTEFFKKANADKEKFYRLRPRPEKSFELFKILIEDYTKNHNKKYWLQKTSPAQAMKVMDYFNDGYFIVIRRNIIDTLKSMLQQSLNKGIRRSLNRAIYSFVIQKKMLNEICRRKDVICIKYENLIGSPEMQIRNVCDFIGIQFDYEMLNVPYIKNTSFKKGSDRKVIFNWVDKLTIKIMSNLFSLLPLSVMRGIRRLENLFEGRVVPFPRGTFCHVRKKYNL